MSIGFDSGLIDVLTFFIHFWHAVCEFQYELHFNRIIFNFYVEILCVMSLFDTAVFNSTLYEALYLQIGDTLAFARDFFDSCVSSLPVGNLPDSVNLSELSLYEEIAEIFYFNEFQFLLLKTFFLILLFTLLLIFVSWKVYGKRISERFMKPGESFHCFYLLSKF